MAIGRLVAMVKKKKGNKKTKKEFYKLEVQCPSNRPNNKKNNKETQEEALKKKNEELHEINFKHDIKTFLFPFSGVCFKPCLECLFTAIGYSFPFNPLRVIYVKRKFFN